jgi:hypothetical protein
MEYPAPLASYFKTLSFPPMDHTQGKVQIRPFTKSDPYSHRATFFLKENTEQLIRYHVAWHSAKKWKTIFHRLGILSFSRFSLRVTNHVPYFSTFPGTNDHLP